MGDRWVWNRNVVAFSGMAFVECTHVGLHTLYKAANLGGLNYFVYITYSYTFGTLLLFPIVSIFSRRGIPRFKLRVLYRIILLSLMGFIARICSFKGLDYSSPTLSSAISTVSPAMTFILAVVFRMEILDLRSSITQAKIIGTIVSVSGALVMVFYKGPIISSSSPEVEPSFPLQYPPRTPETNWLIGGLLFTTDQLLNSSSYILQVQILEMYPNELIMSLLYCVGVTIMAIPVSFLAESDLSAWRLRPDITLIAVIYATFFGPVFLTAVHACCLRWKGPLYTSIFKPFSIVVAAAASVTFLGDALRLGSVVGATILLLGFYSVLWGKAKEEQSKDCVSECNMEGSASSKTPLL